MDIDDYLWREETTTSPKLVRKNGEDIPHLPGVEDELVRMRVIAAHNEEVRRLWNLFAMRH